MTRQAIDVPVLSEALRFAPLAPVLRAGEFVYVSGMPPFSRDTGELVRGDITVQTRTCLQAVEACLQAGGATLDDVVNVRIYCANSAWFNAINAVYAEFLSAPFPTRTFVPVASWPAEFDVEVDAVAHVSVRSGAETTRPVSALPDQAPGTGQRR